MSTIPDLLDPKYLDHQRKLVRESGYDGLDLSDEAVAELTYLGRHPTKLRRVTLPLVSRTSREELNARRLIVCDESEISSWEVTDLGNRVADLLGSSEPEPTETSLPDIRSRIEQLIHRSKTR
jgi:hypothetical protein